jgi:Fic family protein
MHPPKSPKDLSQIISQTTPELLVQAIQAQSGPLVNGAYLHWDELRHRTPPDGLTHEQWWLALGIARQALSQELPLLAKHGQPFTFGVPEPVQIHLHHIDQDAAGQIRSPSEVVSPERKDEYLLRSLIEESITSSQLEGASTTRKAAVDMLREGRRPRDHSEKMIYNNFRTMQAIQGFRDEPITIARLLEVHSLIAEGTLPDAASIGRFRQSDDVRVVDNDSGAILHQPPSHAELPERMERLCRFANAPEHERPFVHPILKAILLHFMIGYDHPFEDGNGRTARALFYWSMLKSGYWLTEFISISRILKMAPGQYGRAYLYAETDRGDVTYFLLHQLATIRRAITGLYEYLARKAAEQKSIERLLVGSPTFRVELNHRQRALLAHALKHPGESYRIDAHQRSHGIVYQTARMDLLALAGLGLLEQRKQGRAYVFIAPADLERRLSRLQAVTPA